MAARGCDWFPSYGYIDFFKKSYLKLKVRIQNSLAGMVTRWPSTKIVKKNDLSKNMAARWAWQISLIWLFKIFLSETRGQNSNQFYKSGHKGTLPNS